MPARQTTTTFDAIRTEGGLLPAEALDRILRQDTTFGGLGAKDYLLPESSRLLAEISDAWQAIQTHYASFRRTMTLVERDRKTGTTETRNFVQMILRELGYRDLRYVAAAETIGDRAFAISHRAGTTENAPPVHIISFRQKLDERADRTGGGEKRSPQALLQGYLNATPHLWGLLTNGLVYRLLRENRQIDRVVRLEFDLGAILEAENFPEFQLFWLTAHRSRLVLPGERQERAWLERWSQTAASEGTRALTGLRKGVETAIEAIGQGLLVHPHNELLKERLRSGDLSLDDYYGQLLRLVYRLLFLMVAEERQLLFAEDAPAPVVTRYRRHYSLERLRAEAGRIRHREQHHDDLWRSLLITFDAMADPTVASAMGLQPLGGGLYGAGSCPDVADLQTGADHARRPRLSNAALLGAVEALSQITRDGLTRRINYRDLDAEELGGVYEGLLELRPELEPLASGDYRFAFGESTSRKETGSYYTPRVLVQQLLDTALDPVIGDAIARATTAAGQERALLELNVCDPACGSGHFLLGAARRIGRRLAQVRAGAGNEPEPDDLKHATAEAIRHCVYGVDKSAFAVDLCKVALWIESHEAGAPLGFLDHHIKRGDSLIGVFDLGALETGIPDDAYTAATGDDKSVVSAFKARNRAERAKATNTSTTGGSTVVSVRNLGVFDAHEREDIVAALAARLDDIDAMPEGTVDDVMAKAAAYARVQDRNDWSDLWFACDVWTYGFFARLIAADRDAIPTSSTVRNIVDTGTCPPAVAAGARQFATKVGFFHWRLAFPDVFRGSDGGGFDAVLGNPPWEMVQFQEKEFFASRDPTIANASSTAARDRLIKRLPETDPALAEAFDTAKRAAENASLFLRKSDRFPLTGKGRLNLYSVFAEQFRTMLSPRGRAGIAVQTGIVTDDSNKAFFADLVTQRSIQSFFGFENEEFLFPNVDHRFRFGLLTIAAPGQAEDVELGFYARRIEQVRMPTRVIRLTADDFRLFNPNTLTCPIFRSSRDAELTRSIYERIPILVDESDPINGNPWGLSFRQGLFNMSSDSGLFRTKSDRQ